MGVPAEKIQQRVKERHEFNAMLDFRGCRLGIVYSEISEMQARSQFGAVAEPRVPIDPAAWHAQRELEKPPCFEYHKRVIEKQR
jgi:hypothetical protein